MNFAASSDSGGGNSLLPLLLLVGLFALMYFMVIRPQSQRRKQMAQMQASITAGSKVITIGGLHGTVTAIDDDTVTLEVAPGVENRYARAAIGKVLPADEATEAEPADDESGDGSDDAAPGGETRTDADNR